MFSQSPLAILIVRLYLLNLQRSLTLPHCQNCVPVASVIELLGSPLSGRSRRGRRTGGDCPTTSSRHGNTSQSGLLKIMCKMFFFPLATLCTIWLFSFLLQQYDWLLLNDRPINLKGALCIVCARLAIGLRHSPFQVSVSDSTGHIFPCSGRREPTIFRDSRTVTVCIVTENFVCMHVL